MATFTRLRRYRTSASLRKFMEDTLLQAQDFIALVFVHAKARSIPIKSMPFAQRFCLDDLLKHSELLMRAGIKAIALFPVIEEEKKTNDCHSAFDEAGLVPKTIEALKKRFPELLVMADVALDPFHPEGQDGLLTPEGVVDNDSTLEILAKQALCYARAGADIVAPSDMMDGRVARIREALEQAGCIHTLIVSYSVKFASCLYGPFRDAVDSARFLKGADKKTYQLNPGSAFQIELEAQADLSEGADVLLVKPGLHYLDVVRRLYEHYALPIWSYHVSGECSMLFHAANQGVASFEDLLLEALLAQKRAGSQKIITYFALEAANLF